MTAVPAGGKSATSHVMESTSGGAFSEPADDLSEVIAAAVLAVPGVAGLHGGNFGQVASYLPGRSVTGVRIRPEAVDVHVTLFLGTPVLATAERVREAVLPLISGVSAGVDITVDDVVDPAAEQTDAP